MKVRQRSIRREFELILLILGIALCGLVLSGGHFSAAAMIVSCLWAGTFFLSLFVIGFFSLLRSYPRRSDVVLFLVAGAISWATLSGVSVVLGGGVGIPSLEGSCILAAIIFICEYVRCRYVPGRNRQHTIAMGLQPIEGVRFLKQLRDLRFVDGMHLIDLTTSEKVLSEADLIVTSPDFLRDAGFDSTLIRAHLQGIPIRDHIDVLSELTGRVSLESPNISSYLWHATPQNAARQFYRATRSFIEPVIALLLLVLLLPSMVLIGLMIFLADRGPAFVSQRRVGHFGREFRLIKFRTMIPNAEVHGIRWSGEGDLRVTRIGAILRRTRLDELPQLFNVISGSMSFIGPRPERPEVLEWLEKEIPLFRLRCYLKPGITGWAQVSSGYASSIAESKLKLEHDLYYFRHLSPRLDFVILLRTFLLSGRGAELGRSRKRAYYRSLLRGEVHPHASA